MYLFEVHAPFFPSPMHLSTLRAALLVALFAFPALAFAQGTVRGTVTDAETDQPLPGVTVFVQATNTGTTTDVDGGYELTLPPGQLQRMWPRVFCTS